MGEGGKSNNRIPRLALSCHFIRVIRVIRVTGLGKEHTIRSTGWARGRLMVLTKVKRYVEGCDLVGEERGGEELFGKDPA
jgi:hypothetical protein